MRKDKDDRPSGSLSTILADLKTVAIDSNDDICIALVKSLEDHLETSFSLIEKTNDKFDSRKHKESTLVWYKKYNAVRGDKSICLDNLSANAIYLLDFMCNRMTSTNYYGLNQKAIVQQTRLTRQALNNAIKELYEAGLIMKVKEHSKTNPTIYAINSEYAHYGDFCNRNLFVVCEDEKGQPYCILDGYKKGDPLVSSKYDSIEKIHYNHNDMIHEKD